MCANVPFALPFQIAFDGNLHENVLEQILVEFDPDSAEFIKYTQQVYDDIEQRACYDLLRYKAGYAQCRYEFLFVGFAGVIMGKYE